VFDGEKFLDGGGTALVRDGRVVGVETGFPDLGAEWEIVDFPDATVLPGLVDTHVHLVADSQQNALDRVEGFTEEEIDEVVTDGLRRSLAAGVTTVRDLGDRLFNVVARRDRQRRTPGLLEPTIVASGPPLTSPGGHCYYMGGEIPDRATLEAAVRARAERGVDVVKGAGDVRTTSAGLPTSGP
jgi:imidazolonepropionase-like amidohydrolase